MPHRRYVYRAVVRNVGTEDSAPCNLRFRIENKGVEHFQIPALVPEEHYGVNRSVYWATHGKRDFSLRVDSRDEVTEKD